MAYSPNLCLQPVFISKVLLEHCQTHLFMCHLWLLLLCSGWDQDVWPAKAVVFLFGLL